MNNFIFQNPTKIIFGRDTIKNIGKEIKNHGIKKVLIIYGKGSIHRNGVYDSVIKSLKEENIDYTEIGGVKSNPVLSKVHEAIEIGRRENVDGILALGGGSTIDTSKAVSAGMACKYDIWEVLEGKRIIEKALPIFTVLTMSATGSEMNGSFVITREEEKKKWSAGSPFVFPKVSIIDPTVQYTLPKNQTSYGAVDAISHVLENYFIGEDRTDVIDEMSEGIIRAIIKHAKILLNDPENYNSRCQIAWGATMALNGNLKNGKDNGDWATHGIEHSISAFTDIAHGAGLAIIHPAWMKYVYKEDIKKFRRFGEKIFNISEGTDEEIALKGIEKLKEFFKEIGVPITLKEIGLNKSQLNDIADNVALSLPRGKIKVLDREDVLNILNLAYE
ncbi:iron-containing alcohol dehydrogenase [Gottschalkia acidurici 9a]|uniref:Iron-containing alcohol dehydrogenase n=1 Tax=Gottschalkia acidurici (strain ATCC 7906 / DSM 604 / BCRC 14475 / CIP 104303 / KCTC 5404 / NCIMB 10678 / 9a) TaxID=1128398 RepID=K0B0T8_GOTA9|nr:iron-containing alcohol dehydrogenase [Gottschalkia acidurici]AFS79638.1 iron-containing alcohol dehydrogenase [Gottschalkia acidurici 9a]